MAVRLWPPSGKSIELKLFSDLVCFYKMNLFFHNFVISLAPRSLILDVWAKICRLGTVLSPIRSKKDTNKKLTEICSPIRPRSAAHEINLDLPHFLAQIEWFQV
jgi:hypothetical protein